MKLTFLGTRGYIEPRTERHHMHSSLRVSYYHTDVVIDCGEDWLGEVGSWQADAVFVTHAHPDHAGGLKEGAPCPVYATEVSWEVMEGYDLDQREVVPARQPIEISGITFEAFPVLHSTRAPAVGYRVSAGQVTIFYVPDVVWIEDREGALGGADVYVGDGATVARSMVRKVDDNLIGHTPLRTQLTWCQKEGVPRAIFTHCGSEIVQGDPDELGAEVDALAEERDVEAEIACDGMEVILR
jgi:phosphoribosyl 1,2-cyclic phosphodiesterase